jgi:hypothetical protein
MHIACEFEMAERVLASDLSGYWTSATVNPYQVDISDLSDATSQLMNVNRFRDALRCLGRAEHEKLTIDPSHAIAKILDAPEMDAARDGYRTASINRRNACFSTKGRDERAIAAKYREQAIQIEGIYPRLAITLRDLAKFYEHDAERQENFDPFDD